MKSAGNPHVPIMCPATVTTSSQVYIVTAGTWDDVTTASDAQRVVQEDDVATANLHHWEIVGKR